MALVTTLMLSTLLFAQAEGGKVNTDPSQVMQAGAILLTSPDGKITVRFELKNIDKEKGVPVYSVTYEGRPVLAESRMGFLFRDVAPIRDFEVLKQTTQTVNTVWKPIAGERETIPDHYNEVVLDLLSCKGNWKARQVNVTFRAYNEGVAFNYHFPKDYNGHVIDIIREKTQFAFSADHTTWAIYGAQSDYSYGEMLLSKLKVDEGAERPLTVKVEQNLYASISEARIADYARMKLRPSAAKRTTLEVFLDAQYNREGIAVEGEVMGTTPMTTPWRVIMIADSPGKLLEQNYIIQNLNDPCVLTDTSWIKPGKVIRSGLSTQDGKACIDFAVKRNLQYIEFDAGWYGSESNPSSDARAVEPSRQRSLNLPEVIAYGKEKGIGVILYVNHLAMEKQLDEILPLYEKWGIKGVKYGFVHVGSQYWTKWLHEAIRKAAACHLMVDIHDEFRSCGYERTYPNLMTVEGIGGNETMPTAKHNAILPFTRYLTGPGDYTPCWSHKNLKNTKSHQMALSTIYYSPWQFLYWYSEPKNVPDEPALDYWDQLPATWDETRVLQGVIGKRVVVARRKGSTWFVGATAPVDGKFVIALNFLSADKKYMAKIFSDQPDSADVSIVEKEVDSQSSVDVDIPANGGVAIRISPVLKP
jgi:alpha-glucosidase